MDNATLFHTLLCTPLFRTTDELREWTRNIWNEWFDEVFPATPAESDWSEEEDNQETKVQQEEKTVKR